MASRRKKQYSKPKTPERSAVRHGMVRKEFWLDPESLLAARKTLGLATERETVQQALDLVAFRGELIRGVRSLKGLKLGRID
jgi:hypothetical protein